MWPQLPVQTKVRIFPYLLIIAALLIAAENVEVAPVQAQGAAPHGNAPGASRAAKADIPRAMLARYQKACRKGETWQANGRRYACWAVLAGIGKVETNHNRGWAPRWRQIPGITPGTENYAGAGGPMQFLEPTWQAYGRGDRWSPDAAVPAARRLLLANGARARLDAAVYSYNHSWGYVAQVKALARRYQKGT